MVKTKIIKEVIKEREVVDIVLCDICHQDVKLNRESSYDASTVNINAKIGASYPDGDNRVGHIIDVCPTCFMGQVKPLLEKTFNLTLRTCDIEGELFEDFCKSGF